LYFPEPAVTVSGDDPGDINALAEPADIDPCISGWIKFPAEHFFSGNVCNNNTVFLSGYLG
jgi:hypothetical protein